MRRDSVCCRGAAIRAEGGAALLLRIRASPPDKSGVRPRPKPEGAGGICANAVGFRLAVPTVRPTPKPRSCRQIHLARMLSSPRKIIALGAPRPKGQTKDRDVVSICRKTARWLIFCQPKRRSLHEPQNIVKTLHACSPIPVSANISPRPLRRYSVELGGEVETSAMEAGSGCT